MRYYIGGTAAGTDPYSARPQTAKFIVEGDEPSHLAGEYTEERLRERIERMRAHNEPVPPEYEQALKTLVARG